MACVSRGDYMPRYGGLLWYTGGDFRTWGAQQWWYNASCYFCPIPATGHFELLESLHTQYFNNYDSYDRAARQQWGSKGIYIPETNWFDGLEDLPDTIASEMRELYLARKPWTKRSRRFREFAKNKNMFESRWNWHLGTAYHRYGINTAPFSYVTHIFSATAKIAFLFWRKYAYTLDHSWLKERAYPMLKGAAEFYVNFPNAVREADGKIHLHYVNNHEAHWNCRDSIDEMTAVHGILPVAIRASTILGIDTDLRETWQSFLKDLAPLPLNTHPDAIEPREEGEPVIFTGALKPKAIGSDGHYHTDCPLQHFDLITLETDDHELREIARNSYLRNYREHITSDGVFTWNLDTESIAASRIGHSEGVRLLVPAQIKLDRQEKGFDDILGSGLPNTLSNRLMLREGPEAIDAQRLGRSYLAIQNALCLCAPPVPGGDPVIRLFAAWPVQWDAEFKLAVPGGFMVASAIHNGITDFVEIASAKGSECVIHNPWPSCEVILTRNGNGSERLSGEILRFPTQIDEKIVLQKG